MCASCAVRRRGTVQGLRPCAAPGDRAFPDVREGRGRGPAEGRSTVAPGVHVPPTARARTTWLCLSNIPPFPSQVRPAACSSPLVCGGPRVIQTARHAGHSSARDAAPRRCATRLLAHRLRGPPGRGTLDRDTRRPPASDHSLRRRQLEQGRTRLARRRRDVAYQGQRRSLGRHRDLRHHRRPRARRAGRQRGVREVRRRPPCRAPGRNPRTGEPVAIAASRWRRSSPRRRFATRSTNGWAEPPRCSPFVPPAPPSPSEPAPVLAR